MYRPRLVIIAASAPALVATLACAARRPAATEARDVAARHAPATSKRNVLGGDELRQSGGSNAFDVIQKLRPLFLWEREPLHPPTVYVDGVRLGGTDTLREVPVSDIAEIRYLDSREATQSFGTGYSGGIIQIVTVRRR